MGTLRITGQSIRFESPHGGMEFPLSGVQVEMGGAGHRMVFFKHAQFPGCSLFTAQKAILKHPELERDPAVVAQCKQGRRRRLLAAAGVLCLLLAIPAGLWLAKDPVAGLIARNIPVAWEEALGREVFKDITNRVKTVASPEVNAQFGRMLEPLFTAVGSKRYQFKVHIVEDLSLNAFALPGGIVVVHTGLILKADRPEEVLGVLGHELAHVTRQHGMRTLVQRVGLMVMLHSLLGGDAGSAMASGADFLLGQKFSRDHEREADDIGMDYLLRAGIDPQGLVTFFEKIQKEQAAKLGDMAEFQESLTFLSTHPGTDERIERLKKRIARELKGRSFAPAVTDFKAFQDQLRSQLGGKD